MIIDEEEHLAHYGVLRRSGRYPWGSGGPEVANNRSFLDHVAHLKKQGLSDVEICIGMGIGRTDKDGVFHPSTTQLRAAKSIARHEEKQNEIAFAQQLKDKGMSNVAIGERMGKNESYVRTLLAPGAKDKADSLQATTKVLKDEVARKKYVDVGVGTQLGLEVAGKMGVSQTHMNTALAMLQEEGYEIHPLKTQQIGTGKDTNRKILAAPGTTWGEVQKNRDQIQQIDAFSEDLGRSFTVGSKHPPVSIDPSRLAVRYKEQGGSSTDGVIYFRPGLEDLSLGEAHYAQVRIKVGDNHFLKGMAMQKDDLPPGVDLLFNTNKSDTGNKLDALKKLEDDPDLPFGSITRPLVIGANTPDEHVKSAMNIVNEEGDWGKWSKSIASQVLSKQPPSLARNQLDMTYERREQDFNEIMGLTNPTVKKKLLESFADATDAAAVHLKAAALPRQSTHVILPIESMPPNEVYAPKYKQGEKVILVRYPHAGTFELPELRVNNHHPEARRVLGDAKDAIGIHESVAAHLSGADFDGDTVLVIPNNNRDIKTSSPLEDLKNFDPMKYKMPEPEGGFTPEEKRRKERRKQQLMGEASNLITDMTIRGASHEELARAARYSMVAIDSAKHNLDVKRAAADNSITSLKREYQKGPRGGASTIVSKAKSPIYLNDRKARPFPEGGPVDKETGQLVFVDTGKRRPDGELQKRRHKLLAVTDDAHELSSGTPIENLYADHSNRLKALANQARKEAINTPTLNYSSSAKRVFSKEVESLNAKLAVAERNAPLERQAQSIAQAVVKAKRDANPNLDDDDLKKVKTQALTVARNRMGANKKEKRVILTPEEWKAIQAGAISDNRLQKILRNTDLDQIKELATPRTQVLMSNAMTNRAKAMRESGYTRGEIADALGVSISTLDRAIEGGGA